MRGAHEPIAAGAKVHVAYSVIDLRATAIPLCKLRSVTLVVGRRCEYLRIVRRSLDIKRENHCCARVERAAAEAFGEERCWQQFALMRLPLQPLMRSLVQPQARKLLGTHEPCVPTLPTLYSAPARRHAVRLAANTPQQAPRMSIMNATAMHILPNESIRSTLGNA